ncbi:hypothetical protein NIES4071_14260 [Calothrix sp. NIES-4071]|nr:hypothetical protein NIES4071_14260 [Calothrix sp. NIES-4071]BAZ55764.1 hypothetical protein NIES4105_14210 [Calothrix sp. NIES-4105]
MEGVSFSSGANIQLAAGNIDINSSNINAKDINLFGTS